MNERIKELFKQAYGYFPAPVGEQEAEKFAKLVVQECASWVNMNVGLVDEEAKADLLKHFGFEE